MLFILGMHRSGTSLLMEYFCRSGFLPPQDTSERPHYESREINFLNDALLKVNGWTWQSVSEVKDLRFPAVLKQRLIKYLKRNPDVDIIKDPRLCITFPLWESLIDDLDFVVTFRHPLAVAKSLALRNNLDIDTGLELWYQYNSRLLSLKAPFIHFGSNVPFEDYLDNARRVCSFLDIDFRPVLLERIYNESRVHMSSGGPIDFQYLALYNKLIAASEAT